MTQDAPIKFSRAWHPPSGDTFSISPIRAFVLRHLAAGGVSIDPFARNSRLATYTNDLNPDTTADSHMDAAEFLAMLAARGVRADVLIFDPPYSPRQISDCYQGVGREVGMGDTQNAGLYARVRDAAIPALKPDAKVLSFGWNTVGMGRKHGFMLEEVLIVCHGGAHNDTLCIAERRVQRGLFDHAAA